MLLTVTRSAAAEGCLDAWRPAFSARNTRFKHRGSLRVLKWHTHAGERSNTCLHQHPHVLVPWHDHRQPETPKRSKIQGKQVYSQVATDNPQPYVHFSEVHNLPVLFPTYNYVWAYPRALLLPLLYLCKVLFDWFSAISSCKSTISIMLDLLRWCPPLLSTLFQLRDGWRKTRLKAQGKEK